MNAGTKQLVLLVGGAFGFTKEVYDRADYQLSFSKMTFSHEMIRVFIAEQVYRAFTILKGESYHND
jgi:23S rRNA (pseudouridine1915-N3)-methyltransferase